MKYLQTLVFEKQIHGQQWVFMRVADSGPGILPDELPYLFDRFFRGTAALAAGVPGAGLGLFVAKEIVARHRGRIEVGNEGLLGKGATFTIWLPTGS